MIYLSKISISYFFTTIALCFSCNSIENYNKNAKTEILGFEEMRRLNFKIDLKETTVLNTFHEILALYQKLEDTEYAKSYPIPTLEDQETLIILKPVLKKEKHGDIEIVDFQNNEQNLTVFYKEIPNLEYQKSKVSNPILIIKTAEKFKTVHLTLKS